MAELGAPVCPRWLQPCRPAWTLNEVQTWLEPQGLTVSNAAELRRDKARQDRFMTRAQREAAREGPVSE